MPTSDEDLQKEAARVQRLREQVANAEATRVQRQAEVANDVTMMQLKAEAASLEARLTVAKESGKVSNVKQGAEAPIAAAEEQMRLAVAQQKAAEAGDDPTKAVDPQTTPPPEKADAPKGDGDENKEN